MLMKIIKSKYSGLKKIFFCTKILNTNFKKPLRQLRIIWDFFKNDHEFNCIWNKTYFFYNYFLDFPIEILHGNHRKIQLPTNLYA